MDFRQRASPTPAQRQHSLFPESIFESLSTASIGAYAVNVEQRILFWNRSAQQILGYPAEQVLGRRCSDVLVGLTAGSLTPECEGGCPSIQCLQAGQIPGTLRLRMLCASGTRKSVSLTPMVIGGGGNDAPLLVHLFSDGPESDELDEAAESVRHELTRSGYDIVSDRPSIQFGTGGDSVADATGTGSPATRRTGQAGLRHIGRAVHQPAHRSEPHTQLPQQTRSDHPARSRGRCPAPGTPAARRLTPALKSGTTVAFDCCTACPSMCLSREITVIRSHGSGVSEQRVCEHQESRCRYCHCWGHPGDCGHFSALYRLRPCHRRRPVRSWGRRSGA